MIYLTHQVPVGNQQEEGRQQQGQGHQNPVQVQGHLGQVAREEFCMMMIRMTMITLEREKDEYYRIFHLYFKSFRGIGYTCGHVFKRDFLFTFLYPPTPFVKGIYSASNEQSFSF